jgi:hypothetical protein
MNARYRGGVCVLFGSSMCYIEQSCPRDDVVACMAQNAALYATELSARHFTWEVSRFIARRAIHKIERSNTLDVVAASASEWSGPNRGSGKPRNREADLPFEAFACRSHLPSGGIAKPAGSPMALPNRLFDAVCCNFEAVERITFAKTMLLSLCDRRCISRPKSASA